MSDKKGERPAIKLYLAAAKDEKIDYENDGMGALWLQSGKKGYYLTGNVRIGLERTAKVVGFIGDESELAEKLGQPKDAKPTASAGKRRMPWDQKPEDESQVGGDDDDMPF